MPTARAETTINASPKAVFDWFTPERLHLWYGGGHGDPAISGLTPGPVREGSTWTVTQAHGSQTLSFHIEVLEHQPNSRFRARERGGRFDTTFAVILAPDGDATRVTLEDTFTVQGVSGILFRPLMLRTIRKVNKIALDQLKQFVEG